MDSNTNSDTNNIDDDTTTRNNNDSGDNVNEEIHTRIKNENNSDHKTDDNNTISTSNVKEKITDNTLRVAIPTNENNKFSDGTSPPVNDKLTNLQDSIKVTKDRKSRKSFSESLAELLI